MTISPIDFSGLTTEERLALIGELWDSLDQHDLPAPSVAQLAELDRRADDARNDPAGGRSWEEVRADLLKRIG